MVDNLVRWDTALEDLLFATIDRAEWAATGGAAPEDGSDRGTIYVPLAAWLAGRAESRRAGGLAGRQGSTLVVGVTGSVGVGKTTTAALLADLLRDGPWALDVAVVSTDGFLFPNAVLDGRGLLDRKGFPESYDTTAMVRFLAEVRAGRSGAVPVYSHRVYDIVPGEAQEVAGVDVVVLEGINVLQVTPGTDVLLSDLLDVGIYLDADEADVRQWFSDRLVELLRAGADDAGSFYHRWSGMSAGQMTAFADNVWSGINLPNLRDHIAPSRFRADLIVGKGPDHRVRALRVRR